MKLQPNKLNEYNARTFLIVFMMLLIVSTAVVVVF